MKKPLAKRKKQLGLLLRLRSTKSNLWCSNPLGTGFTARFGVDLCYCGCFMDV